MDDHDNDLEKALRETPYSALLIPLVLSIVIAIIGVVIVVVVN